MLAQPLNLQPQYSRFNRRTFSVSGNSCRAALPFSPLSPSLSLTAHLGHSTSPRFRNRPIMIGGSENPPRPNPSQKLLYKTPPPSIFGQPSPSPTSQPPPSSKSAPPPSFSAQPATSLPRIWRCQPAAATWRSAIGRAAARRRQGQPAPAMWPGHVAPVLPAPPRNPRARGTQIGARQAHLGPRPPQPPAPERSRPPRAARAAVSRRPAAGDQGLAVAAGLRPAPRRTSPPRQVVASPSPSPSQLSPSTDLPFFPFYRSAAAGAWQLAAGLLHPDPPGIHQIRDPAIHSRPRQ